MAPEQATADPHVDHRADIYAFGAVAYELLTGRPPFTGASPQAVLAAHVTSTVEPVTAHRASIPPALAALVTKCLEKKPADRWQSADELIPQLEAVLTPSGGMTPTDTPPLSGVQVAGLKRWGAWAIVVGAVAVAAVGIWLWRDRPGSVQAAGAVHTIAVISLTVANADTAQEYFSDGITDELTTALAQVPGLAVINRGSAAQFKGVSVNPREIAAKLGVDHIVELRVRRSGATVRVDADLVNCANGVAVWSHGYRGDLGGLRAMQDDISGAIVGALRVRTAGPPRQRHREPRPEAFEAYLRGRSILNRASTKADYDRALDYFNRAMTADSTFAEPYGAAAAVREVGAGVAYSFLEAYPKAESLSRRAIHLDDENAEAHTTLGWAAALLRWDWAEAQRELERALELNPNSALAHFYSALFWAARGQLPRAVGALRKSARLDPAWALSGWLEVIVWDALGEPDSAIVAQRRADEVNPGFIVSESFVSAAYRQKGMLDTALALDRAAAAHEQHPTAGLVLSLVALGRRAEAKAAYREMVEVEASRPNTIIPEMLAVAAFAVGDRDGALTWLEKGVEMHSDASFWGIRAYPELRPLLADPRYQRLLDRMHLPY
jgi:serine/threonine-protein kinase